MKEVRKHMVTKRQRREKEKERMRKVRRNQKISGKKTVSITVSPDVYNVLVNLKTQQTDTYSRIIERALLIYRLDPIVREPAI